MSDTVHGTPQPFGMGEYVPENVPPNPELEEQAPKPKRKTAAKKTAAKTNTAKK